MTWEHVQDFALFQPSLAGHADVVAADINPFSSYAISLNSELNDVQIRAISNDLLLASPPKLDLLLIGHLFNEKDLSNSVLKWSAEMTAKGAMVLVDDPKRSFFPV